MTSTDFRRIALSLEGAEEASHMGSPDFRVGGRIFATLASQSQGYGNLMLTPEVQAAFVEERPDLFLPVAGGWGRMGATHVILAKANKDVLEGALRAAWKLRVEKNQKASSKGENKNAGRSGRSARQRNTKTGGSGTSPSVARRGNARAGSSTKKSTVSQAGDFPAGDTVLR
jgi:hypothetical protein